MVVQATACKQSGPQLDAYSGGQSDLNTYLSVPVGPGSGRGTGQSQPQLQPSPRPQPPHQGHSKHQHQPQHQHQRHSVPQEQPSPQRQRQHHHKRHSVSHDQSSPPAQRQHQHHQHSVPQDQLQPSPQRQHQHHQHSAPQPQRLGRNTSEHHPHQGEQPGSQSGRQAGHQPRHQPGHQPGHQPEHQSGPQPGPQSGHQPRPQPGCHQTVRPKAGTWMDILSCHPCRRARPASHEPGSADDERRRNEKKAKKKVKDAALPSPSPRRQLSDYSLRRPLTCKFPFGKRAKSRERREARENGTTNSGFGSSIREHWRSLPNLRSPSMTVRAMTLKFKSLTSRDTSQIEGRPERLGHRKRAHFNEEVDVILHDDDGNEIDTQCVRIKYDDDDGMTDSAMSAGGGGGGVAGGMAGSGRDNWALDRSPVLRDRSSGRDRLRLDHMDIRRRKDGTRFIRCVIHIGDGFDRKRITVRSANGGTKLILLAFRSEPLGDGTHFWREYSERFRLPHAIDPHDVTAVLHSAGDLVIEAPLFEFEADT